MENLCTCTCICFVSYIEICYQLYVTFPMLEVVQKRCHQRCRGQINVSTWSVYTRHRPSEGAHSERSAGTKQRHRGWRYSIRDDSTRHLVRRCQTVHEGGRHRSEGKTRILIVLFISCKSFKGFLAITFLLLVISTWNFHNVCQRYLYNLEQNFSLIRQKNETFSHSPPL